MKGIDYTYSEETIKTSEEIKEKAFSLGADLVGIITAQSIDAVPSHFRKWDDFYQNPAYTKKTIDYLEDARSVVVLGFQVWDDIQEAYVFRGEEMETLGYMRMRLPTRNLQRFIQSLGYKVKRAGTETLLSHKRMAQLAGFGNFGKNSLIINPKYGPWFRLEALLTDTVLAPEEPFTDDLCGDCEECIKACPVGALSPYTVDPSKCFCGAYDVTGLLKGFAPPKLQSSFNEHCPSLTSNSILSCMTCQKACKYGREERGLPNP